MTDRVVLAYSGGLDTSVAIGWIADAIAARPGIMLRISCVAVRSTSRPRPVELAEGVQSNTIGGTAAGAGNVISGNARSGISIFNANTDNNLVQGNVITDNPFDCGVTAPGHNPFALDAAGHREPSRAGVYANIIRGNWITNNGLQGEGAGVLFANASAGTASYMTTWWRWALLSEKTESVAGWQQVITSDDMGESA